MASGLGSNLAGVARVVFEAQTTTFYSDLAKAEAKFKATIDRMEAQARTAKVIVPSPTMGPGTTSTATRPSAATRAAVGAPSAGLTAAQARADAAQDTRRGRTPFVAAGGLSQTEDAIRARERRAQEGLNTGRTGGGIFAAGGLGRNVLGIAGITTGLVAAGAAWRAVTQNMKDAQRVAAQTDAVIKSTGGVAGVTAEHVQSLGKSIQQMTAFEDEQIIAGENMLLTFKNIRNVSGENNDIFDQSTRVLVDMAAAFNKSTGSTDGLQKMSIQLGRALNDPLKGITALTRQGVTFDEQQKATIKQLVATGKTMEAQKIILAELNSEFGGSAAAQVTTYEGKMKRLKASLTDSATEILTVFLPALGDAADSLNRFVTSPEFKQGLKDFTDFMKNELLPAIGQVIDDMKELFGWIDMLIDATVGWTDALKILLGLKVASILLGWSGALLGLIGVGTAAGGTGLAGAASSAGLLGTRLGALRLLGPIGIGIVLNMIVNDSGIPGWLKKVLGTGASPFRLPGQLVDLGRNIRLGIPMRPGQSPSDAYNEYVENNPESKPTPTQKPIFTKTDKWLSNPNASFVRMPNGDVQVQGPDGTVWHTYRAGDKSFSALQARARAKVPAAKQPAAAKTYAEGRARTAARGATGATPPGEFDFTVLPESLVEKESIARASKSEARIKAALVAERRYYETILKTKNMSAAQKRAVRDALTAVNSQISAINSGIAAEEAKAQSARDKAADAAADRRAKSFETPERITVQQAIAADTARDTDDEKWMKAEKMFLLKQLARKKLSLAERRDLYERLGKVNDDLRSLRSARRDRRADARAAREQREDLLIENAMARAGLNPETTAEQRILNREERLVKKRLAALKGRVKLTNDELQEQTALYQRLARIRADRNALNAKENRGKTDSARALEFLGLQSGFFSSFGGNAFTGEAGARTTGTAGKSTNVTVNQNFNGMPDPVASAKYTKFAMGAEFDG